MVQISDVKFWSCFQRRFRMWNITCRRMVGNSCVGWGCFKRTQTASWVRADIQQKHLEKFRAGQEVLRLSDHRFLLPCIKHAEWLPHYSQFTRTTTVHSCCMDTWWHSSSNQSQASLQLIVQGLLVSSFESLRLASENLDCAPLTLESCPFISVPLSKAAQYTKDLGSVPELSHMLWFQAWLNLIKANTTGSFLSPTRKQLCIWRPCVWY